MQFIGICSLSQCENYITNHIVFLKGGFTIIQNQVRILFAMPILSMVYNYFLRYKIIINLIISTTHMIQKGYVNNF